MKTTIKYAPVGSVSSGTLREIDLLNAFCGTFDECVSQNRGLVGNPARRKLLREADRMIENYYPGRTDDNEVQRIVEDLFMALDEFAPPFCTFGANDGDGSDFGFWPCWEQIEELPYHWDSKRDPTSEYKFVNDHGNVTVYAADGTVLLELV